MKNIELKFDSASVQAQKNLWEKLEQNLRWSSMVFSKMGALKML